MAALQSLDLSANAICGVASYGGRPPAPYTSEGVAAILAAARESASLHTLSVANNRMCGVWTDSYGTQSFGTYAPAGVEVVAEMLGYEGKCTLTHLDVSSNGLGNHGGKARRAPRRTRAGCARTRVRS